MLSRNVLLGRRLASVVARRNLSTRASAILSSLDIPTTGEVSGVYDGAWGGSGEVFESVCPTTGEVVARVKSVRDSKYLRHDLELSSTIGQSARAA